MHLVIAKVDETYFDGEAYSVTVPAQGGEMTVLGEHMPLVTTLKEGVIRVREVAGADTRDFQIPAGGVLEVRHDGATIIL